MKKIFMLAMLFLLAPVVAYSGGPMVLLDSVDLGIDDARLVADGTGWGRIASAETGGGYGGISAGGINHGDCDETSVDNLAQIVWDPLHDGDTPWATIILQTSVGAAKQLQIRALDGAADDSFRVYVRSDYPEKDGVFRLVYTFNAVPKESPTAIGGFFCGGVKTITEGYRLHTINLPMRYIAPGLDLEVKIVATGPAWGGINSWGQLAIDYIELYGRGPK